MMRFDFLANGEPPLHNHDVIHIPIDNGPYLMKMK